MTTPMLNAMTKHKYLETLLEAKLATPSKKQYRHKLLGLVGMMNKDFDWIIDHPEEVVEAVNDTHDQEQTRKAYIAAIKAMFKYNDDIRCKHPGMFEKWHEAYTNVDDKIKQRYINREATEKDKANWVVWEAVLAKEKELAMESYGSRDHLLLAMYCLIEPLRQDYGSLKICARIPKSKMEGNYIVLTKSNPRLILNDYKTAKSYGQLVRALPAELVAIIKASLEKSPREYLFVDGTGKPYNDESYTKLSNRILENIFKKNFTVSMMRHSFINTINSNDTKTVFEKAKNMGHSVETQLLYKKDVVADE